MAVPTLVEYPFASRNFDVAGLRMHYVDEGPRDAEAVVMVHGNPSWSYYWRKAIASLRAQHRCIAMDHIGMGLSDKPGDDAYDYTLSQRIADLEALLAAIAPEGPLTLLAHDWGGMIAMGYAVRHPQRVARIALLNTAAFHLPAHMQLPWELELARAPMLGALAVRGLNAFCLGAIEKGMTRHAMAPEVRAAYLAPYDSWAHRIAVHRFVQDIPLDPGDRAYATVTEIEAGLEQFRQTPVQFVWGMRDFVFDGRFLARWRELWPHAAVHAIEDAGHYVLEDAASEVVPVIERFIAVS